MMPNEKKVPAAPMQPEQNDAADFAEEAAPKSSEFGTEKDAKDITAGEFDPIP